MNKSIKAVLLGVVLVAGLATRTFGAWGQVILDNAQNYGDLDPYATTGGLVWTNAGSGPGLLQQDIVNVTLFGGSSAGSMAQIATLAFTSDSGMNDSFEGVFYDPSGLGYDVRGVAPGASATLKLQFWLGNDSSYAEALSDGSPTANSGPFNNPTGWGLPPGYPAVVDMVNMPAVIIMVPEPSTLGLAGLGVGIVLAWPRRKS